jgi:hypothetical protein
MKFSRHRGQPSAKMRRWTARTCRFTSRNGCNCRGRRRLGRRAEPRFRRGDATFGMRLSSGIRRRTRQQPRRLESVLRGGDPSGRYWLLPDGRPLLWNHSAGTSPADLRGRKRCDGKRRTTLFGRSLLDYHADHGLNGRRFSLAVRRPWAARRVTMSRRLQFRLRMPGDDICLVHQDNRGALCCC